MTTNEEVQTREEATIQVLDQFIKTTSSEMTAKDETSCHLWFLTTALA